jgi:uncharacterized membrane protein
MFRRSIRSLNSIFPVLLFIIIVSYFNTNTKAFVYILAVTLFAIALVVIYKIIRRIIFVMYIKRKHLDKNLRSLILKHSYWQGQTEEQLIDSLGKPVLIDRSVLKTKTKDVWKYHKKTAKRFGLRIIVENGTVIGWEKRT